MIAAVAAAVRAAGGVVVDDLGGRAGPGPPDRAFVIDIDRPADAAGVVLADPRLAAGLSIRGRLRQGAGRAQAEFNAAELCHRLTLEIPALPLEQVLAPPPPRQLAHEGIAARVRMRLLAAGPIDEVEHRLDAMEAVRAAGLALMNPLPDIDELVVVAGIAARSITETLGLVEVELDLRLDPLRPDVYRSAHAAMVAALRDAGRRVDDDGSGRVTELSEQRDPSAAELRLVGYAGWSIQGTNVLELAATFPLLF